MKSSFSRASLAGPCSGKNLLKNQSKISFPSEELLGIFLSVPKVPPSDPVPFPHCLLLEIPPGIPVRCFLLAPGSAQAAWGALRAEGVQVGTDSELGTRSPIPAPRGQLLGLCVPGGAAAALGSVCVLPHSPAPLRCLWLCCC